MTLLTTPDRVEVKACWAPMTSLFSRLTSAPVWARVKKAIGWRSTWAKTSVRRSKMSPSPIREEYHRWTRVMTPSTTARTATSSDRRTTTPAFLGVTPWSMIWPSSSGGATTSAASITTSTRNAMICRL